MFGRQRKSKRGSAIGCGFVLSIGLLICLLLLLNSLVVRAFLNANLSNADQRIAQAAQFVVPVLMIYFEFWFYDLITRTHLGDEE